MRTRTQRRSDAAPTGLGASTASTASNRSWARSASGERALRRTLRRVAVALALGLALTLGTAGVSPATASASSCPPSGQRFKTATDSTVYLIGPGGALYKFGTSDEYFSLYDSYSGITTVSDSVLAACGHPYELFFTDLEKFPGNPDVYIYDYYYGYRKITSQAVFDKYGFSRSKILTSSFIAPIASDDWWG